MGAFSVSKPVRQKILNVVSNKTRHTKGARLVLSPQESAGTEHPFLVLPKAYVNDRIKIEVGLATFHPIEWDVLTLLAENRAGMETLSTTVLAMTEWGETTPFWGVLNFIASWPETGSSVTRRLGVSWEVKTYERHYTTRTPAGRTKSSAFSSVACLVE